MPFREKTAWISLVSMLVIYGWYFMSVIQHGTESKIAYSVSGMPGTILALVVVQVVVIVVITIHNPRDARAPYDERAKIIDLKATRTAYAALVAGTLCACLLGAISPPMVFNTNALLGILVSAEVIRLAHQIIQYRFSV